MSFKLIIRHNLQQTLDDFDQAEVRTFERLPVRCGTDTNCDCRIDCPGEAAETWFELTAGDAAGEVALAAAANQPVFLNDTPVPVASHRPLTSGDLLRVGHLTLRFQRFHPPAPVSRSTDLLARLAKLLLAIVFVLEIGFVYWLPRRLHASRLLATEVLRERTVRDIDNLRARVKMASQATPGSLAANATAIVDEELDRLAAFVRQHQDRFETGQWLTLRRNLDNLKLLVDQADSGRLGPPLPNPPIEAGAQRLLESYPPPQP